MAVLHAFFDRDVFIKIACCDIWAETLEALGVTHPYRLASAGPNGASSVLRRRMSLDPALQDATLARIATMAAAVPLVPEEWVRAAVTDELYRRLLDTHDIESGEAQLALVALYCVQDNRLVSGDKRFMQAMADAFPGEFLRLRPALVTFERCLMAVCGLRGFDAVRERLVAARGCDRTLKIAVGADGAACYDEFRAALVSFDGNF